jgi:ATP-dependent Clp protease ATP-binding subunit ClpA
MLGRAADQARRLDHSWVGPEHYLLALLAEPSVATEALAELGVTYDRLYDHLRNQEEEPEWAPPRYERAKGLSPNPAAYKLEARAEGLALAWGHRWPAPEHFLLAMVYEDDGAAARLHIWAHRSRRSWRRCGGAGFACPRWSRPCTGRGVAITASRSTRRS